MFFSIKSAQTYTVLSLVSYLMVCVQTVKDARCKTEILDKMKSRKRPAQSEVLLLL